MDKRILDKSKYKLQSAANHAASAEIFSIMNSDSKSNQTIKMIRSLSDQHLSMMARLMEIPESQIPIYMAMMRGENNEFFERLSAVDGKLHPGDVILMTGVHTSSKLLVKAQSKFYSDVRSSHIAIVLSDAICVDAIPSVGVSHRLISEVLAEVESDWRVIRFKDITEENFDNIHQKCAYYLSQPYKIFPSRKPAKSFSYCSELARKIYKDAGIRGTGIPDTRIIKPCDFDRLADSNSNWIDVTEEVRSYIELCFEFESIFKIIAKLAIDGLKLNYSRFEERMAMISKLNKMIRENKISKEKGSELKAQIKKINEKMHFKFWEFQ